MWIAKGNPQSTSYCFDSEPHFRYFREYKDRPGGKGPLSETMSLQGSCWMLTRDKYWELKICDEDFGSWGSQGIEVAVKTWLSGGRVLVNHNTYYAHMFRTQGGDFSFPYSISGRQVAFAKKRAKEVFFNNAWTGQKYPLRAPSQTYMDRIPGTMFTQAASDSPTSAFAMRCAATGSGQVLKTINKSFSFIGLGILPDWPGGRTPGSAI